MRCLGLIPVTLAGIGTWAAVAGSSPVELPARGLCAHRGAMGTHPENTIGAFREAVCLGAHMIEFDVYLTKDERLVVIHDPTVNRTTDGQGRVSDLTLAQIRRLDAGSWKSPEFRGARIPTLEETLAVMPQNVWLNVHLKGGGALAKKVARVLAEKDRLHQAFLACGAAAAAAARAAVPGILICNMERQGNSWQYVDETIAMKADFIQLTGPITPDFPRFTKKLREHRVRINYFGTDSPDEVRTLFAVGVEFPLVNQVAALMGVAGELGAEPVKPRFREAASPESAAGR